MQSNKDIKKKQVFILKQKLIKQLGLLKNAQSELLSAIQVCAYDELNKDKVNSLKKSVHSINLKRCIKLYIDTFMQKLVYEDDLRTLESWKAEN